MGSLVPIGAAALGLQLLAVVQIEVGLLEAIKRGGDACRSCSQPACSGSVQPGGRLPFMVLVVAGVFLLSQERSDPLYLLVCLSSLCLVGRREPSYSA